VCLWVRGQGSLTDVFDRSVAVVGARMATSYGGHVASNLAYKLVESAARA
jgi:DNA processing protein